MSMRSIFLGGGNDSLGSYRHRQKISAPKRGHLDYLAAKGQYGFCRRGLDCKRLGRRGTVYKCKQDNSTCGLHWLRTDLGREQSEILGALQTAKYLASPWRLQRPSFASSRFSRAQVRIPIPTVLWAGQKDPPSLKCR